MSCNKVSVIKMLAVVAAVAGCLGHSARAVDVVWDGGDGFWDEPNWNGGMFIDEVIGVGDGADGYAGPNEGEEENIYIGSGSTVNYDANLLGADFEMRQGSNLIIHEDATWLQQADAFWSENRWTELDLSNLTLDNGSFRRVGSVPGEGGGALIFGSWQGDDNFEEEDAPLDHQEINISITNGGLLENEGQLWFGSWDDIPANGTVINMTINDGTVDLTGGDVVGVGDEADADLVFTNPFPPSDTENQPTFNINFTGPGSLTVDSSGIINAQKDESEMWQNLEPITYEELWDAGILQANGQSGADGASFDQYFTVEGMLGQDDYSLISMVMASAGIVGDYNNNGTVEQADLSLVLLNWGASADSLPDDWTNGRPSEGIVDQAELNEVLLNWGNASAGLSQAAVPEPASWLLFGVAAAVALACRLRRS